MEEAQNVNHDPELIADEIIIFSHEDGDLTDENSGEKDNVFINNSPLS